MRSDKAELLIDASAVLAESPLWDGKTQTLLWVDIPKGTVHHWSYLSGAQGSSQVSSTTVSAVALDVSGNWVVALADQVARVMPDGNVVDVVALEGVAPSARLNEGKCDQAGRLWVGSMALDERSPVGRLFRIGRSHDSTAMLESVTISNGLDWSPDARTMYYVDSPQRRIDAFDFDPLSGSIRNRRQLVDTRDIPGVIANASTSEVFSLTDEERRREAEIVVDQVKKRIPVLIGAGAPGTKLTIMWGKHARSIGADGLLIVPPYYEAVSVAQIRRHYAAVSDAVDLPIMLYNNPFISQMLLGPEDLASIVKVANIPWIKLTTTHLEHIPGILELTSGSVTLFEGVDSLAFLSFMNGSRGWIAAPANGFPEIAIELWRLTCKESDFKRARDLHRRFVKFTDYIWNHGDVFGSAIKEVCRLRGYPLGASREPYSELSEAQREEVRIIAEALEVIPVGS